MKVYSNFILYLYFSINKSASFYCYSSFSLGSFTESLFSGFTILYLFSSLYFLYSSFMFWKFRLKAYLGWNEQTLTFLKYYYKVVIRLGLILNISRKIIKNSQKLIKYFQTFIKTVSKTRDSHFGQQILLPPFCLKVKQTSTGFVLTKFIQSFLI